MAGRTVSAEARWHVLGIGVTAVDDLLYVARYPEPDTKTPVMRSERQCGGLASTALVAASKLGARCAYAGVLGNDERSEYVLDSLREAGVDTDTVVVRPSSGPIHSTILVDVDRNTRTIVFDRSAFSGPDEERPGAEVIQSTRVLLVDHYGVAGTIRAARIARDAGVAVVGDLEAMPTVRLDELLQLIDHLIVSKGFAYELTGATDAESAAKALWTGATEFVCVTAGAEGCWYVDAASNGEARHQPAYRVDVVDTTGCGDVFHGAYAAALAWDKTTEYRVRFASATAAVKATKPGGQAGIPSRETVERLVAETHE